MKIGTSYFGDLFSTCQQVLGHPCHIWYSLGPKSLTHNHSTRAGPVKTHCVMTGVFHRKWEDCASVPKHWGCFIWTLKIFANFDPWLKRVTCWCYIIKTMPYNGCSQMVSISLKTKKSFIAHPWCLLSVVGLEKYSAHDWRAATSVQRAPVTWREWGLCSQSLATSIGLSTHPGTGVDGASGRGESSQISF